MKRRRTDSFPTMKHTKSIFRNAIAIWVLFFLQLSSAQSFQTSSATNHDTILTPAYLGGPGRPASFVSNKKKTGSTTLASSTTSPAFDNAGSGNVDWASQLKPFSPANKQRQLQPFNQSSRSTVYESARPLSPAEIEYQERRDRWANRYTHLDSLREVFGANRNKVWGDLDAATARRLYKSLLPKALLELVKLGVEPEDLAPLAYQARVAAKLYARERCQVPARFAASVFDGFRQWKRYGKFQMMGMSYDQLWEKYEEAIRDDLRNNSMDDSNVWTDEDLTERICLRILERSCTTNERIDKWVLPAESETEKEDLAFIAETLEDDVRNLLDPVAYNRVTKKRMAFHQYRALRWMVRAMRRSRKKD